jgi:hypothetical protein
MLFVFNAGDLGKYDVLVEKLDQEVNVFQPVASTES